MLAMYFQTNNHNTEKYSSHEKALQSNKLVVDLQKNIKHLSITPHHFMQFTIINRAKRNRHSKLIAISLNEVFFKNGI
ncbi:MAG: hypothetical protein KBT36_03600 [Kurthia sp.]|nr:hypothetical protein [Candidatus Kurthia equi]